MAGPKEGKGGGVDVEKILVRLIGDADTYLKGIEACVGQNSRLINSLRNLTDGIKETNDSLNSFGSTATTVFQALGLNPSLKSLYQSFEQVEIRNAKLASSIKQHGGDVEQTMGKYGAFADRVAATTTYTKAQTMALLQNTEALGIHGEHSIRAVKNAIAMAEAKGGEAASWVRNTVALEKGNPGRLRYLLGLKETHDKTKMMQEAQKLLAKDWELAEAAGKTVTAELNRMGTQFRLIGVEAGGLILQYLRPLVVALKELGDWFNRLNPWVRGTVVTMLALVAAIGPLRMLVQGLLIVFAALGQQVLWALYQLNKFFVLLVTHPIITLVAAAMALGLAIAYLTGALDHWNDSANRNNKILAEGNLLHQQSLGRFEKETEAIKNSLAGIEDPERQAKAYADAINSASAAVVSYSNQAKSAQAGIDANTGGWYTNRQEVAGFKRELDEANERLAKAKERLQSLQDSQAGLSMSMEQVQEAVDKLNEELEKEARNYGLDRDEVKALDLARMGATQTMLRETYARIENNKQIKEAAKLVKEEKEYKKQLQDEIAVLGLSARYAAIYRKEKDGVSASTIKLARETAAYIDYVEHEMKLFEEGERMMVEFQSPMEKLNKSYEKLNDLLARNFITREVYERAAKKAEEDYASAVNKTAEALHRFDAAISGSVEALSRIEAQRDMTTKGGKAHAIRSPDMNVALPPIPLPDQPASAPNVKQVDLLTAIREILKNMADQFKKDKGNKPPIINI
jgi:hypothetical protein